MQACPKQMWTPLLEPSLPCPIGHYEDEIHLEPSLPCPIEHLEDELHDEADTSGFAAETPAITKPAIDHGYSMSSMGAHDKLRVICSAYMVIRTSQSWNAETAEMSIPMYKQCEHH